MNEFNELINKLYKARTYLEQTDYIVIKLAEALANGDDLTELKTTYAEQLEKRKEYRTSIDQLQAEINALDKELKASEEAKNDETIIEDVIEQPVEEAPNEEVSEVVEESPSNTSEVIEGMPSEETTEVTEEPVTEVDTADQTSDNITDTSESIEETPSEQPIKETPTEVVENLE